MKDYLSLFTNNEYFNNAPVALVSLFTLTLMRVVPIVSLAPFFGAKVANKPVKMCLCILITVLVFPFQLFHTPPIPFDLRFIGLCIKELVIGTSLGIFTTMPFYIAESAGLLIDHQRGASSLMVNDPLLQSQNSPIGVLFNSILVIFFFTIHGPTTFIETLHESFRFVPLNVFLSDLFFTPGTPYYESVISVLTEEMSLAIQLASPSLIVIFMTDLFLGIANRLAPQVQISFLGMPLKGFTALFILWLAWYTIMGQFQKELVKWVIKMKEVVSWFGIGL